MDQTPPAPAWHARPPCPGQYVFRILCRALDPDTGRLSQDKTARSLVGVRFGPEDFPWEDKTLAMLGGVYGPIPELPPDLEAALEAEEE